MLYLEKYNGWQAISLKYTEQGEHVKAVIPAWFQYYYTHLSQERKDVHKAKKRH